MVEIKEITSKSDLKKFIAFPDKLYKNNEYFVPDFKGDELQTLQKETNPAFEHCEAKYFFAYKDGEIAGRICALINHSANERAGKEKMRFNRVDFIDDEEVSKALFDAVENWAHERNINEVHGPIGFSDLDKEGLLIEGFDRLGMSITIYNYPYYKTHIEKLGYQKDNDWIEKILYVPKEADDVFKKLERLSGVVIKRNNLQVYNIKKISEAEPILMQIFDLLNECYKNLYGIAPYTDKQAKHYYDKFKTFLDPQYAKFIVDENDKLVGFGLAAPSLSRALRKCGGRFAPFGFIPLLWALKNPKVLDLYLIGVLPEYQNAGVPAILMNEVLKSALANNIAYAETGPEMETNEKVQSLWRFFDCEDVRRRRCFAKILD